MPGWMTCLPYRDVADCCKLACSHSLTKFSDPVFKKSTLANWTLPFTDGLSQSINQIIGAWLIRLMGY